MKNLSWTVWRRCGWVAIARAHALPDNARSCLCASRRAAPQSSLDMHALPVPGQYFFHLSFGVYCSGLWCWWCGAVARQLFDCVRPSARRRRHARYIHQRLILLFHFLLDFHNQNHKKFVLCYNKCAVELDLKGQISFRKQFGWLPSGCNRISPVEPTGRDAFHMAELIQVPVSRCKRQMCWVADQQRNQDESAVQKDTINWAYHRTMAKLIYTKWRCLFWRAVASHPKRLNNQRNDHHLLYVKNSFAFLFLLY